MSDCTLPHHQYIADIVDALTAEGLPPTDDMWMDDGETRGTYCYLNAVITLDPDRTSDVPREDIPQDARWPHGLILIWEWHTGIESEQGEPERGPIWLFAESKPGGSCEYPTSLPVEGYGSPAAVAEAARKVVAGDIGPGHFFNGGRPGWDGGLIGDCWEHADELAAACEAWGNAEGAEDGNA